MNQRALFRQCLVGVAFAVSCSANANVVYSFVSGPQIALTHDVINPVVTTYPPNVAPPPYSASLTFAAPLAAGATTQIDAEYGGFDLVGGLSAGNVLEFGAEGAPIFGAITSALGDYSSGSLGDQLFLFRYSTVQGSITTNAAGEISAWDLNYVLWLANNGGGGQAIVCTGAACVADVQLGSQVAVVSISSNAPIQRTLAYEAINGVVGAGSIDIDTVDTAFADSGATQDRSFTGSVGAWSVSGIPVPAPGTLALMLVGSMWLLRRKPA